MHYPLTPSPNLHGHPSPGPLSRADFEDLCLLRAVEGGGHSPVALAHGLGLSPLLGPQLGALVQTYVARGLVQHIDEAWTLTDAGRQLLLTQVPAGARR
jgi:hypothetical protein